MVIDCGVGTRMSCFLGSLECPVWFVVRSTGQVCTQSECLAVWHLKNSLACRILGDEIEWVMMSTKHTKIKLIFYFLYHRWCTFTVLVLVLRVLEYMYVCMYVHVVIVTVF